MKMPGHLTSFDACIPLYTQPFRPSPVNDKENLKRVCHIIWLQRSVCSYILTIDVVADTPQEYHPLN
jgi:hypothetical protein